MMPIMIPLSNWMLIACIALWTLTIILWISFRMLKKKEIRRRLEDERLPDIYPGVATASFSGRIYHEMLSQQIDTIFGALSSLIEAERIKLHALIDHGQRFGDEPFKSRQKNGTPVMDAHDAQENDNPDTWSYASQMSSTIAELTRQGLDQEDIARRLGLSRNEVRLASKIATSRTERPMHGHLNAVA